jgi:transcriptional regulator with XRE-family HTH domain
MQEVQAHIAKNLKRAMQERGQTLLEFSEELGISRTAMQQYLRGTANPTVDTLATIAEQLGISLGELVSGLPAGVMQAELVFRAAKEIGQLAPDQQMEGVSLFLALVELFSQDKSTERPEGRSAASE